MSGTIVQNCADQIRKGILKGDWECHGIKIKEQLNLLLDYMRDQKWGAWFFRGNSFCKGLLKFFTTASYFKRFTDEESIRTRGNGAHKVEEMLMTLKAYKIKIENLDNRNTDGVYFADVAGDLLTNYETEVTENVEGNIYKGPRYKGKIHGEKCRIEFADGRIYEGPCTEGRPAGNGQLTRKLPDGSESKSGVSGGFCKGEAKFLGGTYTGILYLGLPAPDKKGTFVWDNGMRYEGFVNKSGRPNGSGVLYNKDNKLLFEGEFNDGWCQGWKNLDPRVASKNVQVLFDNKRLFAEISFKNGDSYEGETAPNGVPDGEGKYTQKNGYIYEGSLKAGIVHGKGRTTYHDGHYFEGIYIEGERSEGKLYHSNGELLCEGPWTNGRFYRPNLNQEALESLENIRCSIAHSWFQNPVAVRILAKEEKIITNKDGSRRTESGGLKIFVHYYEKTNIINWLKIKSTCPLTGKKLTVNWEAMTIKSTEKGADGIIKFVKSKIEVDKNMTKKVAETLNKYTISDQEMLRKKNVEYVKISLLSVKSKPA